MEIQAWFKSVDSKREWTIVLLEGIDDVDDLKKAIKKEMEPKLNGYPAARFTIKAILKYGNYNRQRNGANSCGVKT